MTYSRLIHFDKGVFSIPLIKLWIKNDAIEQGAVFRIEPTICYRMRGSYVKPPCEQVKHRLIVHEDDVILEFGINKQHKIPMWYIKDDMLDDDTLAAIDLNDPTNVFT